ncbi:WecB/TagA/CpsF family glycosyltransferase [Mucilaginibacter sp. PAMB04168]|uniref:WecB/TagA/CpsF family glycosyltransferase n=1 Tax=Mucilaginibacter sp. PAMB04168 TaxID=3138567 RepID=UPI0031F70A1B
MLLQNQYSLSEYPIFDHNIDDLLTDNLPQKSVLINTINQYSFCMAAEDKDFKESLQHSDILLPDGVGVVAATRFLTGEKLHKIAGADAHGFLLKKLNKDGGKCFYLGASESTLKKIKEKLSKEYPNVKVGSYSPPFKKEFSDLDNADMVKAVNAYKPDVLFIGMTAPKQEKWAYQHKAQLNARVICTIGAVFDFYAGTVERPSKVWINLGLEWLGRLVHEPKRLWKRYLYYGPVFVGLILKEKFRPSAYKSIMHKASLN